MAQQVDVRIAAAVSGTGEIVNMNEVLKNSMTLIEQMEMKYKKAIFQSASINKINEYSRVQLGGLAVAQEKSAINMEHWNAVNKEAFLIKEKLNITDEQAVVMAEKNLAAKAAEAAQQEALNKKLGRGSYAACSPAHGNYANVHRAVRAGHNGHSDHGRTQQDDRGNPGPQRDVQGNAGRDIAYPGTATGFAGFAAASHHAEQGHDAIRCSVHRGPGNDVLDLPGTEG